MSLNRTAAFGLCALLMVGCTNTASAQQARSPVSEGDAVVLSHLVSLRHGERNRSYIAFAPPRPGATGRPAIVISLHGAFGNGLIQSRVTGFDTVALEQGFIAVYPNGYENNWNDGRNIQAWPAQRDNVDDVGFLDAVIDDAVARFGADPAKVYLTGFSNGGLMAQRYACERANKIAGLAVVGRVLTRSLADSCRPDRPVPFMLIMGTADPRVPFRGGTQNMGPRIGSIEVISAEATAMFWAGVANQSQWTAFDIPNTERGDGVDGGDGRRYRGAVPVELWALNGGGHTWPRGWAGSPIEETGPISFDVHASRTMWAFFSTGSGS